jgi:hypothetical protein
MRTNFQASSLDSCEEMSHVPDSHTLSTIVLVRRYRSTIHILYREEEQVRAPEQTVILHDCDLIDDVDE